LLGNNHPFFERCEEEIIADGRVEGTMIYLPPEVPKTWKGVPDGRKVEKLRA
jgi:hypothetical protein